MWFKKSKRIVELEGKVFDLERALFESQQFERIANEKLTHWVQRHDNLLVQHKLLQKII